MDQQTKDNICCGIPIAIIMVAVLIGGIFRLTDNAKKIQTEDIIQEDVTVLTVKSTGSWFKNGFRFTTDSKYYTDSIVEHQMVKIGYNITLILNRVTYVYVNRNNAFAEYEYEIMGYKVVE